MNPIFAHRILPFGIATFGTDRSESVKRNLQIKVNLLRQVLLQQPIHNNIYNQTIQNINVINPTPKDMNLIDNAITNAKQS